MKKILPSIAMMIMVLTSHLHAQNFKWVYTVGGPQSEEGRAIATDTIGNIYTAGFYIGTIDFDAGTGVVNLSSVGSADIYILKMNAAGQLIWARSIGGMNYDFVKSICVDNSGNVYITGNFQGTTDFDPGAGSFNLSSMGSFDAFVLKLDESGSFVWARSFGGSQMDVGESCGVDSAGNIYTTGSFRESVDFDPGAGNFTRTARGNTDIFIHKLDAGGNFIWAKTIGSMGYDFGASISLDASANVITIGSFHGTADFDPGTGNTNLSSAGSNDIFIQKMDAFGNFLWARSMGGLWDDLGQAISTDRWGNIYTTGNFRGTVDFDPGAGISKLDAIGANEIFIQKLDTAGNFLWAKSAGGSGSDFGNAIDVDGLGNAFVSGAYTGTANFDSGNVDTNLTSSGGMDIFVQMLDPSGNFQWVRSMGGGENDILYDLCHNKGNIYTTGVLKGTMDFDPDTATYHKSAIAGYDIFIHKMSLCGLVSDISTSLSGITITANNSNATYHWLNCDNDFAAINGENRFSFTARVNGNYAVVINENGCLDTSACISINSVGIEEYNNSLAVKVYPNPTSDNLFISFEKTVYDLELVLTNIQGKVIFNKSYSSFENTQLNLDILPGFYFLRIKTPENQGIIKVVKE